MQIQYVLILTAAVMVLGSLVFTACKSTGKAGRSKHRPVSHIEHPEWSRDAVIYEVNVRQYTPEGTFAAFMEHLPRLKEMGVDILWLMPIHPIGEKNRKGGLGSYYSIRDYKAVNPEFGDLDDFRALVDAAHGMGMYVILDWVANHTAWDHAWVEEHPDWYTRDENGEMVAPYDWTDVADLNYENKEMRKAMTDALKYWITEAGIDGYRCDVAAEVPVDFWNNARKELDRIKPVFMLAESEEPAHHDRAFDMTYAWELHHLMNSIARGEKNANDLERYFMKTDTLFQADAYRMNFITNHDENSWNGTEYERMGDAVNTFAMLTFTLPGMPMIYSGQEAAFDRRLQFFEKDSIAWGDYPLSGFYQQLVRLRKSNPALRSGISGGEMHRINTKDDENLFVFIREKDGNEVLVITNLSDTERTFQAERINDRKKWLDMATDQQVDIGDHPSLALKPWEYRVLTGTTK